jgi:methylmalonyl-CoA mutase cobalamin-binding subunit
VIQELRDAGKATPVIVAGNPADSIEQLKLAGVADFVHVRVNAAEVLRAWQQRLGVAGLKGRPERPPQAESLPHINNYAT